MGWDSTPWFVGGGAAHSPEVARTLAYAAFRGNEGVIGSTDLKIKALAVPGGQVRAIPGACAITCRSTSMAYQSYVGRNTADDLVSIAATGSGSGRSDLIVARIEDPNPSGEPWADPVDPVVGPYIFTRVIAGVPNTTRTVAELGLGFSAIPLARIDIPVSTGTITSGMITDLRFLANVRRDRQMLTSFPVANNDLTSSSFIDWPSAAVRNVVIPAWATQARVSITISGVLATNDLVDGYIRLRIGGTVVGQDTRFDTNSVAATNQLDKTMMTADTVAIPAAMRGTTQAIAMQGRLTLRGVSNTGLVRAYVASTVVTDIEFVETPE